MQIVRIGYSGVPGVDVNVRAFALDINIDGNSTFANIRDFNKGEANGAVPGGKSGYGIFPSRFRDFVNPLTPDACYANPSYNPTAAWNEPGTTDHNSGMGWPKMIVEMGTLYAGDANRPALTGTLFRFDVNGNGQSGTFHLAVKPNALRGSVVNSDGNTITPVVSTGTDITFASDCATPLNEIGQLVAAALAAWQGPGQGFTNFNGVGVVDCNGLDGKVISYNPTTCVPLSTTINYTYGIQPTVPNLVTPPMTKAAAEAAILAAHFTVGVETGVASDTIPINQVTSQVQTAGTQLPCGTAIDFSYVCHRVTCATCLGDLDGNSSRRSNDVTALVNLLNAYGSPYRIPTTSCLFNPCADMDGNSSIRSNDLTALVNLLNAAGSPYRVPCP